MDSIKNIVNKSKRDIYCLVFMAVIITIVLAVFYKWSEFDLNVPFHYASYGDNIGPMGKAKLLTESTKSYLYERLAAPYSVDVSTNYPTILSNTTSLAYIILSFVTKEPGKIVNIYYFSLFYFIALAMYVTMRQMKVREWISALGSLNFAFLPYLFFNNTSHLVLSEYQFVPFVFLICYWLMFDEEYLRLKKGCWRNPKNIFTVIVCIFIANNGIGYYPFFSCFFFCVIGLYKLAEKKYKDLGKIATVISITVIGMISAMVPAILSKMSNSGQKEVISRSYQEIEEYSLSLIRLFIPTNSHGIPFLQELRRKLGTLSWANENTAAYLGIIGILGFCILVLCLLKKRHKDEYDEKMNMLSTLLIFACLFATVDGLNLLFAFLITDTMRTFTRISVFIACICILGFGLYAENILAEVKQRSVKGAAYVVIIILFVLSICEQIPTNMSRDYSADVERYYGDKDFVEEIEAALPEDSMVFQLPVQLYPEGGYNSNLVGFIHSDSLRWSYGAIKTENESKFLQAVASLRVEDMLEKLVLIGYSGVYVDIEAYGKIGTYEEADGEALVDRLHSLIGDGVIYSRDGKKVFFNLKNYQKQLNITDEDITAGREVLLGNEAPGEYYASDFSKFLLENTDGVVEHLQGVTPNLTAELNEEYVWIRDEFSTLIKVGNKKESGILISYSVLEALYATNEEDTKMEIYVDGNLVDTHILAESGEQTIYIPAYKLPDKAADEIYRIEIKVNHSFVPSQLPDYFPGSMDNEQYSLYLKSIEEGKFNIPTEFLGKEYEPAITWGTFGNEGEYVWVSDSFGTLLEVGNKCETGFYIYYFVPTVLAETAEEELKMDVLINGEVVATQEIKESQNGYCYISKEQMPEMKSGDTFEIELKVNHYFVPALEEEYYPGNTDMNQLTMLLESIVETKKPE